jgi:hypothetical protein
VLRKIFGSKGEEVIGEWKRLNIEDLYNLNSSPNIIQGTKSRRMWWAVYVARVGDRRRAYRDLVGKQEGKTPFGKSRRRWEVNIKIYLQEVGYGLD